MTALCGGGTSAKKAASPAAIFLAGEVAAAVLQKGLKTSIWSDLIVYAASQSIDLTSFCTSDPPAVPSFNVADIAAILTGNPFLQSTQLGKLSDLLQYAAWYAFCECTSGALTPVAPPVYPASGAQIAPPGTGFVNAPCKSGSFGFFNPTVSGVQVLIGQVVRGVWVPAFPGGNPQTNQLTLYNVNDNLIINGPGPYVHTDLTYRSIYYSDDITTAIQTTDYTVPQAAYANTVGIGGPARVIVENVPPTAQSWQMFVTCNSNGGTEGAEADYAMFCNGASPLPCTPCPPDPVLTTALENIKLMLQGIWGALPINVTSMSEGAVHAGLTGSGTVTLAGACVGVKVAIAVDNINLRTSPGVPPYLWDRGFIVALAAEGPLHAPSRLVYNPQLFLVPSITDQIGWQTGPGVTISITELHRGP